MNCENLCVSHKLNFTYQISSRLCKFDKVTSELAGACSLLFLMLKNLNETSIKNPSYSGDQLIRVNLYKIPNFTSGLFIVQSVCWTNLHSWQLLAATCNLSLRNVMQCLKHLEPSILIETYRIFQVFFSRLSGDEYTKDARNRRVRICCLWRKGKSRALFTLHTILMSRYN